MLTKHSAGRSTLCPIRVRRRSKRRALPLAMASLSQPFHCPLLLPTSTTRLSLSLFAALARPELSPHRPQRPSCLNSQPCAAGVDRIRPVASLCISLSNLSQTTSAFDSHGSLQQHQLLLGPCPTTLWFLDYCRRRLSCSPSKAISHNRRKQSQTIRTAAPRWCRSSEHQHFSPS